MDCRPGWWQSCTSEPIPNPVLCLAPLNQFDRADLRGAAALALRPYLPFTRQYNSITAILPVDARDQTANTIAVLLKPLGISPDTIDSLISLALFTSAIRLARQSSTAITFEPHAFTEEWQCITHALLSQPTPLRTTQPDLYPSNPYSTAVRNPPPHSDSPAAENYMSNHRLLPSVPIIPTTPLGPGGPLEPALRIAALLHLKELLPDWPRNIGGYAVLLHLLRQHLGELIRQHRRQSEYRNPDHRGAPPYEPDPQHQHHHLLPARTRHPSLVVHPEQQQQQQQQPYHYPRTEPGHPPQPQPQPPSTSPLSPLHSLPPPPPPTTTTPATPLPNPPNPPKSTLQPVLIFLCLLGATVSRLADANEGRPAAAAAAAAGTNTNTNTDNDTEAEAERCYPRAVFRDCLRELAGLADGASVDALGKKGVVGGEGQVEGQGQEEEDEDGEHDDEHIQHDDEHDDDDDGLKLVAAFELGMVFCPEKGGDGEDGGGGGGRGRGRGAGWDGRGREREREMLRGVVLDR